MFIIQNIVYSILILYFQEFSILPFYFQSCDITTAKKKENPVRVAENRQHISPLNVRSFLLLFFYSHDSHQPNERGEIAAGWWASPDNTNKSSHQWVLLHHFCCVTQAEKQPIIDWVLHWHKSCSKISPSDSASNQRKWICQSSGWNKWWVCVILRDKTLESTVSGWALSWWCFLFSCDRAAEAAASKEWRMLWTWGEIWVWVVNMTSAKGSGDSGFIFSPDFVSVCASIRRKDWIWAEGQRIEQDRKLRSSTQ